MFNISFCLMIICLQDKIDPLIYSKLIRSTRFRSEHETCHKVDWFIALVNQKDDIVHRKPINDCVSEFRYFCIFIVNNMFITRWRITLPS